MYPVYSRWGNSTAVLVLGLSVHQGFEPRFAGAPARVHTAAVPLITMSGCMLRRKERTFAPARLPVAQSSSVVQLTAWMALSTSRSRQASSSARFRYTGTGTELQILISERVERRVRLLAQVRKFR